MTSSGLRIRDLTLPLTKNRRSPIDGSVLKDPEPTEDELYLKRRKFLVQCRFITPIRGVSAVSVPVTDRTPIIEMKTKLLQQLHELPEPIRPPDSVLAIHGSRYFQRKSIQNDFKANIATDPEQLIFFLDDRDDALNDDVTFYDLGFETSPPLISVYCATDHVWLRIRGFPERYSIPWHLHMTECELAKEVHGLLKPRDMRLVRAVFYKDEEALKMHRKYRRPATEAPPMWKSGGHFGRYETEDTIGPSSSASKNNNTRVLQPTVIPLHEWCQIPPPLNTKIDPGLVFEEIRREAAQVRSEMIREAFIQARDSWFEVPEDILCLGETGGALEYIPRWINFIRKRDGRNFSFRVELTKASEGEEYLDTSAPVGDLAEAAVAFCSAATNKTGAYAKRNGENALLHGDDNADEYEDEDDDDDDLHATQRELLAGGLSSSSVHRTATNTTFSHNHQQRSSNNRSANNNNNNNNRKRDDADESNTNISTSTRNYPQGRNPNSTLEIETFLNKMNNTRPAEDDNNNNNNLHQNVNDDEMQDEPNPSSPDSFSPPRKQQQQQQKRGATGMRTNSESRNPCGRQRSVASSTGKSETATTTQYDNNDDADGSFETQLLSWVPHLVSTGHILENGQEERVPHTHPQLFLPFDDDDEEVSPFGCKEIHTLWSGKDIVEQKYTFLSPDFFFHQRRAKASVAQVCDLLRRETKAFLREPLRFSFNAPAKLSGTTRARYEAETHVVEFDNVSLPRHLSDYGVYNGAEIFVEYFSIHVQSWSNDVAKEVHEAMKQRLLKARIIENQTATSMMKQMKKMDFAAMITTSFDEIVVKNSSSGVNNDDDDDDYDETDLQDDRDMMNQNTKNNFSEVACSPTSVNILGAIKFTSTTTTSKNKQQQQKQGNLLDDEVAQRENVKRLRHKKAKQLQLSVRQRERAVRAAGFDFINVRSSRGTLFRVPVIYEAVIVQDVLELIFCATGDVPMFSIMVGPQGELLAPWTPLKEVEKKSCVANIENFTKTKSLAGRICRNSGSRCQSIGASFRLARKKKRCNTNKLKKR